jgi:hypothetical protein
MTDKLVHFYHIGADGDWQVPVHEHFAALRTSKFPGRVRVGIVGSNDNITKVEKYLVKYWDWRFTADVTADTGFEQVTLEVLRSWVQNEDPSTKVLYAHSKGAFNQSFQQDNWREAMTTKLVREWETCVPLLDTSDVVGIHWVTPALAASIGHEVGSPFFGGNFWWANAGYLKNLPPLGYSSRWDAEAWIGLGDPKITDRKPGFPSYPTSM